MPFKLRVFVDKIAALILASTVTALCGWCIYVVPLDRFPVALAVMVLGFLGAVAIAPLVWWWLEIRN